MKKIVKKKKSNKFRLTNLFILFILFAIVLIVLPTIRTNKESYGDTIQFTPVPAKSNLQLEWFLFPTATPSVPSLSTQNQPITSAHPTAPSQSGNSFLPTTQPPVGSSPISYPTVHPIISPVKSNGQLCSVTDDSGKAVTGSCYCPDLTVTCKGGVGYGANGALYPGVNPCGTSVAPGSGRYCVEKPIIYLYPTVPTLVDVTVITDGKVVISNPEYPADGWKNVLANPDGTLQYNGKEYSELFYESSVNTFSKPQQGITIPTSQLSKNLALVLDQLGLVGHEKQEFLSFWLPKLTALHSPYIFFSVLPPSSKASIDTVEITPKPDTQISFIAYFKPVQNPVKNTLQLPPTPQRKGFVEVEWGGVIDN